MVLKTLVDTILRVQRDPHNVKLAQFLQTLKRDLSRDVVEAFTSGRPLVDRYPNEYRDSPSFLSFLFRVCECTPPSIPLTAGHAHQTDQETHRTSMDERVTHEKAMEALQKKYDDLTKEYTTLKSEMEESRLLLLAQCDTSVFHFEKKFKELENNLFNQIKILLKDIPRAKHETSVEPLNPYNNLEESFQNLKLTLFEEMKTYQNNIVSADPMNQHVNNLDEIWPQRLQEQYLKMMKEQLFPELERQVKNALANAIPTQQAAIEASPSLPALEFHKLEMLLSNQIKTLIPIESISDMVLKPSEILKEKLETLHTILTSTTHDVQTTVATFLQNVQASDVLTTDIRNFFESFQNNFQQQITSSITSSETLKSSIEKFISENASRQLSLENSVEKLALKGPSPLYMLTDKTPDEVVKNIDESQKLILEVCKKLSQHVNDIQVATSSRERFQTLSKHLQNLLETKHAEIFKLLPQLKDTIATVYEAIPKSITQNDIETVLQSFQLDDIFNHLSGTLSKLLGDTEREETDMEIDENTNSVKNILSQARAQINANAVEVITQIFGIVSYNIPYEFLRQEITNIEQTRLVLRTFFKKFYKRDEALNVENWDTYIVERVLDDVQELKNVECIVAELGTTLDLPDIDIKNFGIKMIALVERQKSHIIYFEQLSRNIEASYMHIIQNMNQRMDNNIREVIQYNDFMAEVKRLNEAFKLQLEYTPENTLVVTEIPADDVQTTNEITLQRKEDEIKELTAQIEQAKIEFSNMNTVLQKSIEDSKEKWKASNEVVIEKTQHLKELENELTKKTNLITELNEKMKSIEFKRNIENILEQNITIPVEPKDDDASSSQVPEDFAGKIRKSKKKKNNKSLAHVPYHQKERKKQEDKFETLTTELEDVTQQTEEIETTSKNYRKRSYQDKVEEEEEEETNLKKSKLHEMNTSTIIVFFQYLFLKYFILKYKEYVPKIVPDEKKIVKEKIEMIKNLSSKMRTNNLTDILLNYVEIDLVGCIENSQDFINKITDAAHLYDVNTREFMEGCITQTSDRIEKNLKC